MAKKKTENINLNSDYISYTDHFSPTNIDWDKYDRHIYTDNYIINLVDTFNRINSNIPTLLEKLPHTTKSLGDTAIKHLKQAYVQNNLCFVLGAGVSFNYKIPTWESLLQRLLMRTIEKEPENALLLAKVFSKIFNPSPLIAGRYLQEVYSDPKKNNNFESEVRDALYESFDENSKSETVDEIVKFCLAPGNSPNLDSIITYNYDDIIETKLLEKNLDMPFESVYGQSIDTENNNLKIFHVHGFLPRSEKINDQHKITLGEYVYHEQYTNTYSWNNIVQINKFRDKTCLFIGISLTDPNIRRLLDIANTQKKQKKYHYVFKKRINKNWLKEKLTKFLADNPEIYDTKIKNNILLDETLDFLIEFNNRFEEKDSESLGVKTVWIDDHDTDISKLLKKIREKEIQ